MNNFNDLIKKYNISIPIIQRDYAQGRNDIEIKEIRDAFLETIDKKLSNDENLHLDFIYGSIKGDKFIPLDGQQRLTTLYLLHFYFGKKEKQEIEYLSKFTYETRSSSREFCQKLVFADMDFAKDDLSSQIKDSHWFLPYWENDPTIKSMFVMLDSIHKKFRNKKYFNNLNKITFEFFELEKFGLDDDLYIKMNARGKALTAFENFKASFEAILGNIDKNLKNEFSNKIDKEWIDIFWNYKDKDYLIDEAFMNYFYYITEMLHVSDNRVSKELSRNELRSKLNQLYNNIDNVKFLFSSIDKLPLILKSFEEIFSTNNYQKDKVTIFDNDTNLAKKVIQGKAISLEQKVMLFIVIQYLVKYNEITDKLKDIVRFIRNLLNRIRGLKRSQLYYTQNLRYENINPILKLIVSILDKNIYKNLPSMQIELKYTAISQESLQHEIEKAKLINFNSNFKNLIFELEDCKYLKGDIHNFLTDDISKFEKYKNAIINIYSNNDDTQIIQAMLIVGNYRLWRGGAGGSSKYFFGKKGYWEIILTADKKDFFHKFLNEYLENDKSLQKMKEIFLHKYNNKKDWRYYFIKYNEMVDPDSYLSRDNNLYAWYDDFSLEKMGGTNLNAYHINPYIRTLAIKNKLHYNAYKWDGYSLLKIDKKITELYSVNKGWEINFSESIDETIKNNLISKYNLQNEYGNIFIYKVSEDKDRIEKMTNFINDLNTIANKT